MLSQLREVFEIECQEKHLFDVVQIKPFPRLEYVEWLEKLAEEKFASINTDSPKLPTLEEVNEARLESTDPMLENITKKQLRAVYNLICQQFRAAPDTNA